MSRPGIALLAALAAATSCRSAPSAVAAPVAVPAGIDHGEWDRLLQAYVDDRGSVAYARWKASATDRQALARYLARFAAVEGPRAQGGDLAASAINGYNAFTVELILRHYPTTSIRAIKDSFTAPRHEVGGRRVSLDDLEHRTLRPLAGYRVHAALVCAARSCPPLAGDAYRPQALDAQLDAAMARWLARADLNRFHPAEGRAELSKIFDWFGEDFEKAGGLRAVLRRHGPPEAVRTADHPQFRARFVPYDWSLNDQQAPSASDGGGPSLWDRVRSRF